MGGLCGLFGGIAMIVSMLWSCRGDEAHRATWLRFATIYALIFIAGILMELPRMIGAEIELQIRALIASGIL